MTTLNTIERANLAHDAITFKQLIDNLARAWNMSPTEAQLDRVGRTLKLLRQIAEDALELTQGRSGFWRAAGQAAAELSRLRWSDNWATDEAWLTLRSWNETLSSTEEGE